MRVTTGTAVSPPSALERTFEYWERAAMVQAREEGYRTLSLSVAVHNRSRMMYQRVGFEKVGEHGDSWTMLVNL